MISSIIGMLPIDDMTKKVAAALQDEGEVVLILPDDNGELVILAGSKEVVNKQIVFTPIRKISLTDLLTKKPKK